MIVDPSTIDWKNPDYEGIFRARLEALARIRERVAEEEREGREPEIIPALKAYYGSNIPDFISDWGVTYDPRNVERGLPAFIPFILFDRQQEWVEWLIAHWRAQTPGITKKSRDMGVSWLAMATACSLCLFNDGVAVSCGSRKEDLVDKIGTMKPLLPKARVFMEYLPEEFRGGWTAWRDAPFMRITFPETTSLITGEAGDQIGRGDRASIALVDEAAYLERPELIDMSLSQTTNCRIDISSVNGPNNPFARKCREGKIDVFDFVWRQDPRKDDEWYRLLSAGQDEGGKGLDPVTIAQEVDCDFSASVEGIVIPGAWVQAAVGAHKKLGIAPAGRLGLALDVADEGRDKNAACLTCGASVESTQQWSGKGSDIFATVQRAFDICDEHGLDEFDYDADGLGAGVRGDARIINDQRAVRGQRRIAATGFRGSEGVHDPEGIVEGTIGREGDKGRTNQDYFANRKAQSWWSLRRRFQKTHRWVVDGIRCPPDDIVSINPACPNHPKLVAELSQATFSVNGVGKILIDKKPDGLPSPNLADGVVIRFAPKDRPVIPFTREIVAALAGRGRRRRI